MTAGKSVLIMKLLFLEKIIREQKSVGYLLSSVCGGGGKHTPVT